MWKIKNVEINGKIVVAPMAGISNMTFRRICKSMGASLVVAEMVSDKAITYGNEKTFELLRMNDDERPISQQIFGSDVKSFVEAAKIVEEKMKPDIIDINMGCPVPKVAVKNQAGSALLKNPEKVGEIIKAVVGAVNVPVTVKIRSGWDQSSINAVEIAKIAEANGASAITVHARTRAQGYAGKADWNIIKEVVNAVDIPVIGNGDVVSCYDAKKMLDETGCSAVMIGRGLLGNPWLIKECVEYLESGKLPEVIDYNEKIDMMEYHLNKLCEDKTEKQAVLEIRNHLLNYLKGLPENKEVKNQVCRCKSRLEIINVLENYRNELKNL
ncbi:MAG: tRNA dihydrouridine synthase DusB [Bacilli bacterium]